MKPANFILDLLRTYGQKGTSTQNIMKAANMFAFTDNAIRVTLSRLAARGLVENVSRGHYRLAAGSDPVNDFVEEWRLGESRRRPWSGRFLTVYLNEESEKSRWTLHATGFRQLGKEYWIRPDNLRREGPQLAAWLSGLGLSGKAILAQDCCIGDETLEMLRTRYAVGEMLTVYEDLDAQLKSSAETLRDKARGTAMKESFALGGKALQVLAKDPYLPEEWMAADARHALWKTMTHYDQLGRNVWSGDPDTLPAETLSAGYA